MKLLTLLAVVLAGIAVLVWISGRPAETSAVLPLRDQGAGSRGTVDLQASPELGRTAVATRQALRDGVDTGLTPDRQVAPEALVFLRPVDSADRRVYEARTDAEGRYVFENTPAGRYWLTAARPRTGKLICVVPDLEPCGVQITLLDRRQHPRDIVVRHGWSPPSRCEIVHGRRERAQPTGLPDARLLALLALLPVHRVHRRSRGGGPTGESWLKRYTIPSGASLGNGLLHPSRSQPTALSDVRLRPCEASVVPLVASPVGRGQEPLDQVQGYRSERRA